jgi:hypothetical protein
MKLLIENWRRFLNEEPEHLEEGLGRTLAIGALGLGLGLGSGDAQADAGIQKAPTTQQAETSPEVDGYNALLGLIQFHINSQSDTRKASKLAFGYEDIDKALKVARDGDDGQLKALSSENAKKLEVLKQHLEKYPQSYDKHLQVGRSMKIKAY